MRNRAASTLLLVLVAGACAGGEVARKEADWAEDLANWRAGLDRETREGETSPFTAIDVRMVAAGDRITLGICDGVPQFSPAGPCEPSITLQYDQAEGFRTVRDDGSLAPAGDLVPLARYRLALSRQEDRGRVLVHDPQAPSELAFHGYEWFPPDPAWRFVVRVEPFAERSPMRLATTAGLFKTFERYGRVSFEALGAERSLVVFLPAGGDPTRPEDFFLPFRDATSGKETYAVGRYVSLIEGEGGTFVLDLNRATNPNCAYDSHWNCPIPPTENTLDVAVRAGEKIYGEPGSHGGDPDL